MFMRIKRLLALFVFGLIGVGWGATAKGTPTFDIYFVDVEGGQATLLVTPDNRSILIDTGWPGFNGRDASRIAEVAAVAGLKRIDYVVITHYHTDHVGGVTQLVERLPVGTFVDHGPNAETSEDVKKNYADYLKAIAKSQHLVLKPDQGLPFTDITFRVLTSAGELITNPLPGAGTANEYCATTQSAPVDTTENAQSLGVLVTYGKFRMIDLGDLTKRKELALACPNHMIGAVDLYVVTHHGFDQSNAKPIVWGLHPRIAIMDNGPHKGGSPEACETVHSSPGLEDLWQLHYALDAGKDHNVSADMIANLDENCQAKYIKVSANPDGAFTVLNTRNNYKKTYAK
jgi:beta-lactamase superfamily II metal-dependent hydrolase